VEVEQLPSVLFWRTRLGARELSGVAAGDQGSSGREVREHNEFGLPTHSQSTRMNGAPTVTWGTRHPDYITRVRIGPLGTRLGRSEEFFPKNKKPPRRPSP